MRPKSVTTFLFACILMVGIPVLAHHGSGVSYILNKGVTMEGTVTEFRWQNPHVYIMYDVKDAQGNSVNWAAELTHQSFAKTRTVGRS